jgi:hypothetical protein
VIGLEHVIASRTFLTSMLAAVGVAIAFGPEIRLAVTRIRRNDADHRDELPRARANAR